MFLVVGFLALVMGSSTLLRPFEEAIDSRMTLDAQYGQQADYRPEIDGSIPPDRLEAFIRIRQALMKVCGGMTEIDEQLTRLDRLDEDASTGEILNEMFTVSKTAFGMAPKMGEFFQIRNLALLQEGMGRGEYTYIYTLVYLHRLRPDSGSETLPSGQVNSKHPNKRIRVALLKMLKNQRDLHRSLEASEPMRVQPALQAVLEEEISRMSQDEWRLPWQEGAPPWVENSIAPFRSRLQDLYCESTVALEFIENQKRFLGFEGH